ncbi:hypothetical protein CVT24_002158 [Panaeolus cyanescens]|uniref:Uncharacterized protein n=1 Tax=Panaeolus cyanescens TaxID=181874 RepID=A0A409YHW5_9AGAR|nr:hypothetical protein CVT24_002158 [Panaeolus cyanescens]
MSPIRTYTHSEYRRHAQAKPTLSSPSAILKNPKGLYSDTRNDHRLAWRKLRYNFNILYDKRTRHPATLTFTGAIAADNFDLTCSELSVDQLQNIKLCCVITQPPSPSPAHSKWNRAWKELRNITRRAPQPIDKNGWASTPNEAALIDRDLEGIKLHFPLTGSKYNITKDPRYLQFLRTIPEELETHAWQDPNHNLIHECEINPIPAYTSKAKNRIIAPEDYKEMSGCLAQFEVQLHQYLFPDSKYVIFAVIEQMVLLEDTGTGDDMSVMGHLSQLSL